MDISGIDVSGYFSAATSMISMLLMFGFVIGGAVFIYWGGFLHRYKYKVLLIIDRAGTYEFDVKKGRYLIGQKNEGKFEIRYGIGDSVNVEAPPEEFVYFGNWLVVYRKAVDDHRFVKMKMTPDGELDFDPALSPAAKIAFGSQMEKTYLRFQEKDKWAQYSPTIALIIAAVILAGAIFFGMGMMADPWHNAAAAINSQQESINNLLEALNNRTAAAASNPYNPYATPPG